ncbi:phenoloxidase-activating factor 2-like [Culex pipiens pallens]|uniref:phenoloxidase-activating factor 2-like n=1 Tax=Culex pipiens pallens TaxID=42434 RepID=UPI0022AAB8A0|nr:phenoloxidase-activating factor 2-like [Culex pipiens pallens]
MRFEFALPLNVRMGDALFSVRLSTKVKGFTHSECETALRSTRLGGDFDLHESFLCAGGEAGVDTCTGDGGSPLVCPSTGRYQLAGIVAWGIGCGRPGIAGVYVNSSMYYDWIFRTTELYGLEKEEAEMKVQRK